MDGVEFPAAVQVVIFANAVKAASERERNIERNASPKLVAHAEAQPDRTVPETVLCKLVRKEVSIPCGPDLREQIDVKTACRENPKVVSPVVVNGVDVMEFRHRSFRACECVIFGTAEVRVTVEEYGIVVVRIKRIAYVVCAPIEYA